MKLRDSYDVIVCGGGLAGVAAAVAARREGASVLLIEKYGYLGGMATAGLVNPFMKYWERVEGDKADHSRTANAGLFAALLKEIDCFGGMHPNRVTFHEEYLKVALDRMVLRRGVDLLFHTRVCGVERGDAGTIRRVRLANAAGLADRKAAVFVDATGNADLSALAGFGFAVGREEDGACQPMTLCFRLAGVDWARWDRKTASAAWNEWQKQGRVKNRREDILVFPHPIPGFMHFNSTRILGRQAMDPEGMTDVELEGREQVLELHAFLKARVPGFERSEIAQVAAETGVRESRRILGDYVLTADDILSARKFPDSIARGAYEIDIHNPAGSGTVLRMIPEKDHYTIPLRCLVPRGADNLIVGGRPISSTHEAHSAFRVMPIAMNIGEAAGIAAGLAARSGLKVRAVAASAVQERLSENGGLY